jgi:hypothetical protein
MVKFFQSKKTAIIPFKEKSAVLIQNKEIITANEKLKTSSLHFILKPAKPNRITFKITWIAFLSICFTANVYYIILNLTDYLSFDITTTIHSINEEEAEFPTVSFCSEFKTDYFYINIFDLKFNHQDLKKDWPNYLEVYNDTTYGKCYRFNSGKNMSGKTTQILKSKKSGLADGFILDFYSNTSFDFGLLYIFIHNHTVSPPTIFNKGYWITSGSDNYFIIKRLIDEQLEHPYNNCYKNVSKSSFNQTIIDYFSSTKYAYSQKECIAVCRNLISLEESGCNCSISSLDETFAVKCLEQMNDPINKKCASDFLAIFNPKKCGKYCPLQCDSFSYDITLNIQSIIANGNITTLRNYYYSEFLTYENMSKTYYGIYVYYDDLKYTLINQIPKTEISGLISNIGGTFSLFLGLSIGSFLEIIEILIEFILTLF